MVHPCFACVRIQPRIQPNYRGRRHAFVVIRSSHRSAGHAGQRSVARRIADPTARRIGDAEAAELLGIPDTVTQAGMFPIAYTIGTDFKPAKRLPLDPIVHWDTW